MRTGVDGSTVRRTIEDASNSFSRSDSTASEMFGIASLSSPYRSGPGRIA